MNTPSASGETVDVTFVDAHDSAPLARSAVPLDQLADTFAIHTSLQLGEDEFVVVGAEPETKAEFSKTRRLVVTLRKAVAVDPSQLLYSLPSICGAALPTTETQPRPVNVYVLHEDDWRQCELVDVPRPRPSAPRPRTCTP